MEPEYILSLDLNVMDHLADGLYSSVAAVLTEAVANAWDADASRVDIEINLQDDRIIIADDGDGMDVEDLNKRYLRVGYRKRNEMDTTPSGRSVMGRKGIGKLSLFSIADLIHVETRKSGANPHALRIDIPQMRSEISGEDRSIYKPQPIVPEHAERICDHGTVIALSKLKNKRLRDTNAESLRRKIARRFSVIGSERFRVFVNDVEIRPEHRDDLKFSQYLWFFDGTNIDSSVAPNLLNQAKLSNRAAAWATEWQVRGWIGTVDRPRQLTTPEGNLNSVVVLSRGRLVDEDILPRVTNAEIYTKYVTGQIEADFLDNADEDIVTSDRQRLREDDERVGALLSFVKNCMGQIGSQWTALRNESKTDELRIRYPRIDEWLDKLEAGWRNKANRLLGRIATMEIDEDQHPEDARKELVRHAIFGFERLRLRGDAEELEKAVGQGVGSLLKLLSDRDALEAAHYRDIVANRLDTIKRFHDLKSEDEKERILQEYLYKNLWLLDPSWERPTGDEAMEKRLELVPVFSKNDDAKEKYGRIDIVFRHVAGKLVIVELKRASVRKDLYELAGQGAKYVTAYKNEMPPEDRDRARIEVVFVVGQSPDEPSDRIEQTMNGVSPGSRIIPYDQLIESALKSYNLYLECTQRIDLIDNILRSADGPEES